jgi:Na+/H+ antiporter NhaC
MRDKSNIFNELNAPIANRRKRSAVKKSEKVIIPIGIAFIVFVIYMLIIHLNKEQSLYDNAKKENAIIDHFGRARFGYNFSYHFNIDGKEYKGNAIYFPNSDKLSIGDTIGIMYNITNPANNKSVRDFYNHKPNLYYLFFIPIVAIFIYWVYPVPRWA